MKQFLVIIEAPDRFSADDAKATLEKINWVDGVKILTVMEKQPVTPPKTPADAS